MIVTERSVFLHVPKTGGTWMREVLTPITKETHGHILLADTSKENIFAFVRNPWAWYVSSYNAIILGTSEDPVKTNDSLVLAIGKIPTFEEFLESQMCPSPILKKKLHFFFKMDQHDTAFTDICERWIESDNSWYTIMCDAFFEKATQVGRTETLAKDLKSMLTSSKELTEELHKRIDTTPMKNTGVSIDYRTMYSTKYRDLVYATSKDLIAQFEYTF